jgi:RNA polymerase sigma-70 factor (ECF subfamily)
MNTAAISTKTDKELIDLYLEGQEYALECLINRHQDKVFTSIMMFMKDTNLAEDIFQDTFIKVIHTLRSGTYKEEGKFAPWVMRISYNLCIDHFRRLKRNPMVATSDGFDIFEVLKFADENAEDRIIRKETHHKVRKLVDSLPDEQKEVVILRHYAGLSFKEIADTTGVSINTALGRMRYALINLRKVITENAISM